MHTLHITYDNGSRALLKLDTDDFIKVSIDKASPSDTRVRLVYLEPLTRASKAIDLFFMGPDVPAVPNGPNGPLVTSVAWDSNEPVSAPDDAYELLAGALRDQLTPMDSRDKGDKEDTGDKMKQVMVRLHGSER